MPRKSIMSSILDELNIDNTVKSKIWKRIDIVGDIAILKKPEDVDIKVLKLIAEKLLEKLKYIKSVWCAISEVKGTYRLRDFVHLAGEYRSVTFYKEHGCVFKIDITKVYISPRLSYEHKRIAELVQPNENIINMFAGAGLFSIIIARYKSVRKIISIDINPIAYELMCYNIKLNKVEDKVIPLLGDAKEVVKSYPNFADRILMPLPELAFEYLDYAIYALKDRGYIHVYEFEHALQNEDPIHKVFLKYESKLKRFVRFYELKSSRIVRSVGPRWYQVVLDLYIEK